MLKLMKYEFRKQLMTKIMLLAVLGLAELYFFYNVFTTKADVWEDSSMNGIMKSILLLTVIAVIGILFVSFECIMTYYNDLKTKQSYMLFMVPETTFSVMGAKILSAMLQIVMTSFVFGVAAFADIFAVAAKFATIDGLFEMIQMILHEFFALDINTGIIIINIVQIIISWIGVVILAMFAITLGATFMANSKLRGIVSFVLFIALETVVSKISTGLSGQFHGNAANFVAMAVSAVSVLAAYPAMAYMLKKKVNL